MELSCCTCFAFYLTGTLVVLYLFRDKFRLTSIADQCKQKWFAYLSKRLAPSHNRIVNKCKVELFSTLPKDHILEIGVGTGANLAYFPMGTHLTAYEPNDNFREALENNLKKHSNVKLERYITGCGENLNQVPDESIAAVVCTLVLCSVKDTRAVLREIQRVLKPGGRLFFFEHVQATKGTILYFVQQLVNPLWSIVFNGCSLTRCTTECINTAGFSKVEIKDFIVSNKDVFSHPPMLCTGNYIYGTARK